MDIYLAKFYLVNDSVVDVTLEREREDEETVTSLLMAAMHTSLDKEDTYFRVGSEIIQHDCIVRVSVRRVS